MPLALVPNLATKWYHLHQLQIWPPDCATCITCKFDHQMAPGSEGIPVPDPTRSFLQLPDLSRPEIWKWMGSGTSIWNISSVIVYFTFGTGSKFPPYITFFKMNTEVLCCRHGKSDRNWNLVKIAGIVGIANVVNIADIAGTANVIDIADTQVL